MLLIAACQAYLWVIHLGLVALKKAWGKVIHPTNLCDWSLFCMGLALLDHFLSSDLPTPVFFSHMEKNVPGNQDKYKKNRHF